MCGLGGLYRTVCGLPRVSGLRFMGLQEMIRSEYGVFSAKLRV